MTLRIDRLQERIRLSGELRSEHLRQVKAEMEECGSLSILDLEEVDLVDIEAIRFLNSCEARGVIRAERLGLYQSVDDARTRSDSA